MKNTAKTAVLLLIILTLSACTQSEFMDLSVFIENYNKTSTEKISFADFSVYEKDGETEYCFSPSQESSVIVRLFANSDKKLKECRIILPKADENANKITVSSDEFAYFVKIAENAASTLSFFKHTTLPQEFGYEIITSPDFEGEITKEQDSLYYVFLSNKLVSEIVIYNKWLCDIEETEKPENKQQFAEMTETRTETVPHR